MRTPSRGRDRLLEEKQNIQLELSRHKSRAADAEHERDLHVEATRRHEDTIKRKQEEVSGHLGRIEKNSRDIDALRDQLLRKDEELRHQEDLARQLEHQLRSAGIDPQQQRLSSSDS